MQNTPADDPSLSIIGETPDLHLLQKSRAYQGVQDDDGGCEEDAHVLCTGFFSWTTQCIRIPASAVTRPESMHYGLAAAIREQREHFPAQLLPPVRGQTGPAARLIERGDLDWLNAVPASPATGSRGNQLRDELVAAAAGAMEQVRERFGVQPSDWQWVKIHRAHWLYPFSTPQRIGLDIGPESVDGGVDTLRNTCLGQPAFSAASGAEYRLVECDLEGTTILESTGR